MIKLLGKMYIRLQQLEVRLDISEDDLAKLFKKLKNILTVYKIETIRYKEYIGNNKNDVRMPQVDFKIYGDKLNLDEINMYLDPFTEGHELD